MTQNMDADTGPWGVAIVEHSVLRALRSLWEGPFSPDAFHQVELGVRAFITAPVLTMSRITGAWQDDELNVPSKDALEYEQPFGDHLLDYEFVDPRLGHPFKPVDAEESDFLTRKVLKDVREQALAALPDTVQTQAGAYHYLDAWFAGDPFIGGPGDWDEEFGRARLDRDDLGNHWVFHLGPLTHAKYLRMRE